MSLKNNLAAAAMVATVVGGAGGAVAQEQVRIGFAAGLTGYLAFFDGMVRNGAQMAVDEINAEGGVAGKWPIDFIVRDMRSDAATAAVVARELVADDIHAMITPCDVDPAIAAGQLAQAAEIPMISPCASTPTLPEQVGPYMFNLKTADNLQATVLSEFAHEQGYETAYVLLSPDTPYTDLLPRYFMQAFEAMGGDVLDVGTYGWDQQDFSAEVTAIANMDPKPDVIMTSAYEPHFPAFITQLRNAGVEIPVLGSDGIDSPTTLGLGEVAEGVVFSMAGYPAEGSDLESFYRDYEERFGDYLPFAFSASGYEAIMLFAEAIEQAGSLEGPAIRDALDEIADFPGVTGTTITYEGQDRVALRDVTLVRVEDGQQVFLRQVAPDPAEVPEP
jgi:branched-chain amino acid transport system substrate-binding protein